MALAVGSAVSGIGGKIGGRRKGKDAEANAQKMMENSLGELRKVTDTLDSFQPVINKFAQQGQASFDRYNDMFGGIESSLNDYYNNLNPDMYAAQGNQTAQNMYQNTMNQVNEQLAAQGIHNSGVSSQMGMQYGNQMAQNKSQNIMNAPQQVAQQQQDWLQYGTNRQDNAYNQYAQGVQAQGNLGSQYNQAFTNMANVYAGQSANYNQQAQNYYNQGNQALASGMMGAGLAASGGGWFDKAKPEVFQKVPASGMKSTNGWVKI